METRLLVAAFVYLGSYLPLSLILLIQDFDPKFFSRQMCFELANLDQCEIPLKHPVIALSFLLLCMISLAVTLLVIRYTKTKLSVKVEEAKHIPADLMNYVLPYVVSFMSLDYQETSKLVGFFIFLAWIFWITYKSGQTILNPVLVAFGWKHYEVKYSFIGSADIFEGVCLSKQKLLPRETYVYGSVDDVLIFKG